METSFFQTPNGDFHTHVWLPKPGVKDTQQEVFRHHRASSASEKNKLCWNKRLGRNWKLSTWWISETYSAFSPFVRAAMMLPSKTFSSLSLTNHCSRKMLLSAHSGKLALLKNSIPRIPLTPNLGILETVKVLRNIIFGLLSLILSFLKFVFSDE